MTQRETGDSSQQTHFALAFVSLLGTCVLAVFAAESSRTYDSGELAQAAFLLGGSHPPGQALYSIIGHACLLVPLGSFSLRLAILSAVCVGIAAYMAGLLCLRLLPLIGRENQLGQRALAPVCALGVFVVEPVLRQALRIEVYSLCLALGLLAIACAARGGLRTASIALGLLAALHPPHAVAAFAVVVLLSALRSPRDAAELLRQSAVSVVSTVLVFAMVVAVLPLRARAGAPMWGDPSSLGGLLSYLSGSAYRRNLQGVDASLLATIWSVLHYSFLCCSASALGVLVLFGRQVAGARGRWVGLILAPAAASTGAWFQPLRPDNPDNVAYTQLGVVLLIVISAVAIGLLVHELPSKLVRPALALSGAGLVFSVGLAAAPLRLAAAETPQLDAFDLELSESPPARAFVVAQTDYVAAQWMYAQAVEGQRPDVTLFVAGFATSSWQWKEAARRGIVSASPVRDPSIADARESYLTGAIKRASLSTEIAAESKAPMNRLGKPVRSRGPYLVTQEHRRQDARGSTSAKGTFAAMTTSLDATLSRALWRSAVDEAAAQQVIRWHFYQQALRGAEAGNPRKAIRNAVRAAAPLPLDLRRAIWRLGISSVRPVNEHSLRRTGYLASRSEARGLLATVLRAAVASSGSPTELAGRIDRLAP